MKVEEDKKRFAVVLYFLAKRMMCQGGLPKKIDADLQNDYFEALSDLRIERIEWSAKHLFKTKTWFPMPHEIRDAAMLAPTSVLVTVPLNQTAIAEFTEQQREEAQQRLNEIINGLGQWREA